jgi:hypothetical protein
MAYWDYLSYPPAIFLGMSYILCLSAARTFSSQGMFNILRHLMLKSVVSRQNHT